MNISDENSKNEKSSYPPGFRDISLESPLKARPIPQSRIELHKEDPFSLKVIEGLEKQGLFIRWRYGYRLANRYEVRRIHSGGMGIVWIVEDLFDNRKPYAAKSVKPFFRKPETDEEWERRENAIQRFLEECKIWVDLEKHRHIVHAEFLEKIEGVPLVMSEYIEGGDLAGQIQKGPLPIDTVLDYAIQFCIGMEYANNCGVIVHRDIKPGNIMVTPKGVLKVGDFGLTKAIMASEEIRKEETIIEDSPLNGAIVSISRGFGTPPYMAPEQFSERLLEYAGHPVYSIDTVCDIFAFGLVLYEMIKGRHAYWTELGADRATWDNAHRIASSVSFHPAYVYYFLKSINLNLSKPISDNEQLDNLILKCSKKDPDERYKSFTELKEELLKIFPTLAKVDEGGFKYEIIEDPPPKPNYKNKGKTAFILGREEDAIKFYDKALEENPADTDVWLEKGLSLLGMGRLEGIISLRMIGFIRPSKRGIESTIIFPYIEGIIRDAGLSDSLFKLMWNEIIHKIKEFLSLHRINYAGISDPFNDPNPIDMPLFQSLKDKDNAVLRQRATWQIGFLFGHMKSGSAIQHLQDLLQDEEEKIRMMAMSGLVNLQDKTVIPHLIEIINNPEANGRREAALLLSELGDISVIPHLVNCLSDKDADFYTAVVHAIGKINGTILSQREINEKLDFGGDMVEFPFKQFETVKLPNDTIVEIEVPGVPEKGEIFGFNEESRYLSQMKKIASGIFRWYEDDFSVLKQRYELHSAITWNNAGMECLKTNKYTIAPSNKEIAIKCFEKAISIDPDWQEPKENLKKCE